MDCVSAGLHKIEFTDCYCAPILLSSLVHKHSHYKVVIVRDSNTTNTKTDIPDNTLLPASQSQTSYYVAAAIRVENFQSSFIIGDGHTYMLDNETFVNVPVNIDQEYTVFIRLYSDVDVSYISYYACG